MGLVISKRHRPDSPFASQCHSIVLQPRLPVSPLLSASTHTRSTLQGFRSRIAPQTALSLSPPLSPFPRDCTLHHCTVGPLASVSSSFLGDTELEPKSGAPTDRAFLRGPLPPTRFIARRPDAEPNEDGSPCREPIFLSNLLDPGEAIFVCCSIWGGG